jgi:acetate kinase
MSLLTLNAGSSSIKFAVFDRAKPPRRTLSGAVDRIGLDGSTLRLKAEGGDEKRPIAAPNAAAAMDEILQSLRAVGKFDNLTAVGHRIVHGGTRYHAPTLVTPKVLAELRKLSPLDPDHLPAEIELVEIVARLLPSVTQVACFDTAFHHDMPRVAQQIAIPRRYEAKGVRRYGFHGLSYTFLIQELARLAGDAAAKGRVIFAHLGNGSSLAATKGGKCIDTSMGFTPVSGVVMGTRSGDIDPGLGPYLARTDQMTPEQFDRMINHQSGLLGISETSSDMRDLLSKQSTDPRAAEAVELYCYQIRKWIGAFAATLGGLDTLIFSGGIGENAPEIRRRICNGLDFLGIKLDDAKNIAGEQQMSSPDATVAAWVIPTDEEQIIASQVLAIMNSH